MTTKFNTYATGLTTTVNPQREVQMAWENLNVLVEKVAALEEENDQLRRLHDKSVDAGSFFLEQNQALTNKLNNSRQRDKPLSDQLDEAEDEIRRLRSELENINVKFSTSEQLLKGKDELLSSIRKQHQIDIQQQAQEIGNQHQLEITKLKNNLKESELELLRNKTELQELKIIHQQCDRMRDEISLRDNERENSEHLRTVVQNIDSQLKTMKQDLTVSFNQMSPRSQQENKVETDRQILNLSIEFDRMKVELEKVMNEYDNQCRVNVEQRLRAKEKYYELKRSSKIEQEKLLDRTKKLESKLYLMEQELNKEREFRERATKQNLELHDENRSLLNRCIEAEENTREATHEVSLLRSKVKRFKAENHTLNDRNESLMNRLHDVNLTVMRASLDKDRMATASELYKMLSPTSTDQESLPSIVIMPSS